MAIFGKPGASYLQPGRLDIFVRSREATPVHLGLADGVHPGAPVEGGGSDCTGTASAKYHPTITRQPTCRLEQQAEA